MHLYNYLYREQDDTSAWFLEGDHSSTSWWTAARRGVLFFFLHSSSAPFRGGLVVVYKHAVYYNDKKLTAICLCVPRAFLICHNYFAQRSESVHVNKQYYYNLN